MEEAIRSGKTALAKTTDMLPALKEAGVVDAGGLGFLVFLEGCLFAMKKSFADIMTIRRGEDPASAEKVLMTPANNLNSYAKEPFALEFPYCTEFIVRNDHPAFELLRSELEELGDSLLVAVSGNIAKVHIHAAAPGTVLQIGQRYGTLHDIKIDNMLDQHEEATKETARPEENRLIVPPVIPHEKGEAGLISVSFGEGFREIFLSLGADEIVYGGQTMNPNVEDLLKAVENLPQQKAIILPNNKNIIMVAEQVKSLAGKEVEVLKTKTLPEGLAAIVCFNPLLSTEENLENMHSCINQVKTGLITFATRDTNVCGVEIKAGQYLGLTEEQILTAGSDLNKVALELAGKLITEQSDIITVFYGHDVAHSEAVKLVNVLEEKYPAMEVEPQYGGQPVYYYVFSVE